MVFECGYYWFVYCNPILIICLLITTVFYFKFSIIFYIIEFLLYIYFSQKVLIGLKRRYITYNRLKKLFDENPDNIKKSILYELNETLCESRICKLLCKEFSVNLN